MSALQQHRTPGYDNGELFRLRTQPRPRTLQRDEPAAWEEPLESGFTDPRQPLPRSREEEEQERERALQEEHEERLREAELYWREQEAEEAASHLDSIFEDGGDPVAAMARTGVEELYGDTE